MSNLVGQSLGRYHILEQLGEGGMAIVYKAYDTRLETDVAVKVIRTENLAPNILHKALIRFEREAKSLAKLTHPNIVKVLDYGEHEGKPYLVMPYLPGGTLKQRLTGKPIPWQQAASLLVPIAKALSYAHQQGMIHRDVKPSNILITQSGEPMMTDFGIAKIIDEDITQDLTGTSTAVGTPEYMSPEQVTSKTVDNRADIYSLGIVFYEMVTGRKPFKADTPMAVLFKHASEPLPRPNRFVPGLPDTVERVISTSLAKRREDRYKNMDDFASALTDITPNRTGQVASKKTANSLIWLGGLGTLVFIAIIFMGLVFFGSKYFQPITTSLATTAPQIVYVNITDTHLPVQSTLINTATPVPVKTSIPTSISSPVQAMIKVSKLQAREGPDLRFQKIGDYPNRTLVVILYQYRGWVFVKFPNGNTGWVALEWLELPLNFSLGNIPQATSSQIPVACKKYCE